MAMTDAMDEVDYGSVDFNLPENSSDSSDYRSHAASLRRHPCWLTEGHYVYHLHRDGQGRLGFIKDRHGEPLCSPRKLRDMCQCVLVCNIRLLENLKLNALPSDLSPCLLSEAIFQRQLKAIAYLVSTWPFTLLHVQSVIPTEELLCADYLTIPIEGWDCMSLMDCFTIGLLGLKTHAKLKWVDFTGFRHDRRLCRELLRLPIVWMKPGDRQAGYLHSVLRKTLAIGKERVQRYLNKIASIYSNIDPMVRHGHSFGPITVVLDCKLTIDDVPIGLALQRSSPFRFLCQRAWIENIPGIGLPFGLMNKVFEPRYLSHLEVEEPEICCDESRWSSLLTGLTSLPGLRVLSLPNTVHVTQLTSATLDLAASLATLPQLKKLNMASCTLRDSLCWLLRTPSLRLCYLNLRDARLTSDDLTALLHWPGLAGLKELNLSRNNLSSLEGMISTMVARMPVLTCFSVSYCSLSLTGVREIVRRCMDRTYLKVICVQSFIPPPPYEVRGILEECANIPTLQKCILLPESYAFPGTDISTRTENHRRTMELCEQLLQDLGRPDIELE